jgi:hypothetical protein
MNLQWYHVVGRQEVSTFVILAESILGVSLTKLILELITKKPVCNVP